MTKPDTDLGVRHKHIELALLGKLVGISMGEHHERREALKGVQQRPGAGVGTKTTRAKQSNQKLGASYNGAQLGLGLTRTVGPWEKAKRIVNSVSIFTGENIYSTLRVVRRSMKIYR